MARNLIEEEYQRIEVAHLRDLVLVKDKEIRELQEKLRSIKILEPLERDPILWRPVETDLSVL